MHQVLDMLDAMFISIFDGLKERFDTELEIIKRQFPFEDLVYHRPSLRLNYTEAIEMLNADGFNKQPTDDISYDVVNECYRPLPLPTAWTC